VRGGIPRHLDEIAADLLDRRSTPPSSSVLAAEFARLANEGEEVEYDEDEADAGPMGFASSSGTGRKRAGGKLALGVAVLTVIAIVGAVLGAKLLSDTPGPGLTPPTGNTPTTATAGSAQPIAISPDRVRVVDAPPGNRTELEGAAAAVDGDEKTGWTSDGYSRANFGGIKSGMGLLIDLGQPTAVGAVKVTVSAQGASVGLRTGSSDPGDTAEGDQGILDSYTEVGQELEDHGGTIMVFPVPEAQQRIQYLLVWISKLPATTDGRFKITVNEITVLTP